jgi:hypothetical protein
MKRLYVLILLVLAVALMGPRPYHHADASRPDNRPAPFFAMNEVAEAPAVSYVYTNSFEFTGCANEVGSEPTTSVTVNGAPNCDYNIGTMPDGSDIMVNVASGQYLELDGAFDASGSDEWYFQFYWWQSAATSAGHPQFVPVASDVDQYPNLLTNSLSGFFHGVTFRCSASSSSSVGDLTAANWYLFLIEADRGDSTIQRLKIYTVSQTTYDVTGLHVILQCTTDSAQSAYDGIDVGLQSGGNMTFVMDGIIVNDGAIQLP